MPFKEGNANLIIVQQIQTGWKVDGKLKIWILNSNDIFACADKNEPGRFLGEGVSFRAKLIGVLEVPEARGDRMCQEALADLKMAIRAAGEHKQRIQVHVAIDGLRLRDDKTGVSFEIDMFHDFTWVKVRSLL